MNNVLSFEMGATSVHFFPEKWIKLSLKQIHAVHVRCTLIKESGSEPE